MREPEKSPSGRSAGVCPSSLPTSGAPTLSRAPSCAPWARCRCARKPPRLPPTPSRARRCQPPAGARQARCLRPPRGWGGLRRRPSRRRLPPPAPGGGRPGRGRGVCTDPPFVSGAFPGRPGAQGPGTAPAPGIASLPRWPPHAPPEPPDLPGRARGWAGPAVAALGPGACSAARAAPPPTVVQQGLLCAAP